MGVRVQLFRGEDCTFSSGCEIKFNPNSYAQKFDSNTKYYLLDGEVHIEYEDQPQQLISSPYSQIWSDYINPWIYGKNVFLKVLPSTLFVAVALTQGSTNDYLEFNASTIKLLNSSVTKSMNANSFVVVVGANYTVDGASYSNQKTRIIPAISSRELVISTQQSCSLIYIEPI